jgi:hypothetical protein
MALEYRGAWLKERDRRAGTTDPRRPPLTCEAIDTDEDRHVERN